MREAIAGVLCRCTGYVKPVEAVLRAAAMLRGESVPPVANPPTVNTFDSFFEPPDSEFDLPRPLRGGGRGEGVETRTQTRPTMMVVAPPQTKVVNKPEPKVDAVKLAKGRAVFTDDMELPGMLYGALLTSPLAHARIRDIDTRPPSACPACMPC